jgi:hypothetical protein
MSENLLYFIPIIARALQEPDIGKALRKAFDKIKQMATEKRYAEGFKNFELFMQEAYNRHQVTATDHVRELIAQLGTGMFEGAAQEKEALLDIINSHPEWKAEFEAFCQMEADNDLTQKLPVIEVSSDKGFVIRKTFEKVPGHKFFDGLLPGRYKIKLVNTGWTIWEGRLTANKLIDENLSVAAATTKGTFTYEKILADRDMVFRTYAGVKNGCIEIELTR